LPSKTLAEQLSSSGKVMMLNCLGERSLGIKIESTFVSIGESKFELTASLEPESVIAKFIENRGEGIHHVSLEVDQFDQMIKEFKAKGLRVMAEADTTDFKAAFIHPQSNFGVLTEIIQPKQDIHLWGTGKD
jgi:methylmalonyl-CoA/ethylmalonyl-CoA epimerase